MSNKNHTLSSVKIKLTNNLTVILSHILYVLRGTTNTLDTVRKIKAVIKILCSTGNENETYKPILAVYDLIAIEAHLDIINLKPHPDAIKQFISEFLLDIDGLLIDYESEKENLMYQQLFHPGDAHTEN